MQQPLPLCEHSVARRMSAASAPHTIVLCLTTCEVLWPACLTKSVQPEALTSGNKASNLRSLLPPSIGCSKSSCTTNNCPVARATFRICTPGQAFVCDMLQTFDADSANTLPRRWDFSIAKLELAALNTLIRLDACPQLHSDQL